MDMKSTSRFLEADTCRLLRMWKIPTQKNVYNCINNLSIMMTIRLMLILIHITFNANIDPHYGILI
jgi:hypothetical protein